MDAEFIKDQSIPDGTHLQPGTKFVKKWQVRNTGTHPWAEDTCVSSAIPLLIICFRIQTWEFVHQLVLPNDGDIFNGHILTTV